LKTIDPVNAKIVAECSRQGPNNLSSIARSLKIPIETVRYRFRKLTEMKILQFDIFVRYSKLGMIRSTVFAKATPEGGPKLEKTFQAVPYWTYLTRYFGNEEGYCGVYALPYANRSDFDVYWDETVRLGILKEFQAIFTGDFYSATPNFKWFNFKKHYWVFPWTEWVEETKLASSKHAHPALKDPTEYKSEVDLADLKILALLQQDAIRGMSEIGKHLGFTTSGVKYHWDNHVVSRGVVEGYRTLTMGYPLSFMDLYAFRFKCPDPQRLAQLVNFFSDKIFMIGFAKVLRENQLLANIAIPKSEFEGMMQYMYDIRRAGVAADFDYVKLDLRDFTALTLNFHQFSKGYWNYDLDGQLGKLRSLAVAKAKNLEQT
jgi:DNA-binding Lrp family transcriptional regulator